MFLRTPVICGVAAAISALVSDVGGALFSCRRKKFDRFLRMDFLLSARCSTSIDSAIVEAAVRTERKRSSGSIVSFSSSGLRSSGCGFRRKMDMEVKMMSKVECWESQKYKGYPDLLGHLLRREGW